MNIYKQAIQLKLRFPTTRGLVTTEDLFDIPLSSTSVSLDDIAKQINRELLASQEESFVIANSANTRLELAMEVIKDVIATKLAERKTAENVAATKARRNLLTDVLAQKEVDDLKSMSSKQIKKELNSL